ncbi:tumor necrosis factor receptor superfamily member 1A [Centropristis striata]|uniref:tumor necrosis factor receptor superfamily member 1A n=1 Tax=Centropristis striata TaxID=184440 RepID=UPI0027E00DB2|nr:tumor necrosis factor receptor superfamily member 1A [Centropristis striata]
MEGAGHRGGGRRWNKKAAVGTILLLMCMFIPTLTLVQSTEGPACPFWEYRNDNGDCCNKCNAGFKLVEKCPKEGHKSICTPCPDGQFTDQMNYANNCLRCRRCKAAKHEVEVSPCETNKNRVCRCETNYFKDEIDSETYDCRRCSTCKQDEIEIERCTPEKNTVCECKENYYRVKGKCELCKNCTTECRHHCLTPSVTASKPGHEHLINIIAAVAVGAVVMLVLGVLLTHLYTKWYTKKMLLKPSCQPSDMSPDSCEQALFHSEEPSDSSMSNNAVPPTYVTEQESPNLPDCIPLEIKTSELIYTVLDLVPVPQRKQLVRSLGVNDIEIEQAEMDHKSCREAHYQMLRVWAEKGSRAGGGGQGKMLHWPLLLELLDELRKMHLGRAAEELETKYSIQ